jgi:hypothetical protein
MSDREWRSYGCWQKDEAEKVYWTVYQDTDRLNKDFPLHFNVVQASATTTWKFEELQSTGGFPQTRVIYVARVDIAGAVPTFIMNHLSVGFASNMIGFRKKFDKTKDIDAPRRMQLVERMKQLKVKGDTKLLPMFDLIHPTVGAEEGGKSWGMISVTLRIGFEEAAAYFWDVDRLKTKGLVRVSGKASEDFDVEVQAKEHIKTTLKAFKAEFVSKMRLFRADKNTLVIMSEAIEEVGMQSRASEDFAMRFCRIREKKTKVDIVTRLELGGEASKAAARKSSKRRLAVGSDAAFYFENILSCVESTEEDGRRFGEQLMKKVKAMQVGGSKDEVVKDFISTNRALGELLEQHRFIGTMLRAIVRNKLRRRATREGEVNSKEEARGNEIGSALKAVTLTTQTAAHAVDEWAHQYPEVQEVMRENVWFRPMVETIAKMLFKNSKLGLKARVIFGAVTSMTDLLTDIYVTYTFGRDGKGGYFKASLASLMTSVGIQMLFIWFQNKKLGMRRVLREWFPILLGYKPAVDAYRVTTGAKQEVGVTADPMVEMTCMKCIEMFAEAIPGVIIQLMAIATSDGKFTTAALISLTVSALTTGFASASISYEFDTDPKKREQVPDFYGYIPSKASKRTLVFVSMVLLTAGMLLIKCMTIVMLGLLGGSWAALYFGADVGLFLAVKVLRGDFWYWVPLGGNAELIMSIVARVLVKVVTDFTSNVQFRHPNEVGGVYWAFGFVLTMGSLPVAIIVAESVLTEKAISLAWSVVTYFIPGSLVCFAVFFLNIERTYWHTFWSTQKGKDYTIAYFLEGKGDAVKFKVMTTSRHHWVSIEEKVRKWVGENWARWEEEKPDWFTDQMKAKVPFEFIPASGEARRRESVRRASVDVEAEGGLGGVLRASMRRASIRSAIRRDDVVKVVPMERDN